MKIAGGCYCGEIRFEAEGALEAASQCHCRECQYITGGNPNIVMVFAQRDFRYISGNPAKFARTDLPTPVERYFCQDCGHRQHKPIAPQFDDSQSWDLG